MKKANFLWVLIVIAAVVVGKDVLMNAVTVWGISSATHLPVKLGRAHLSVISPGIDLRDIRVENPLSFPDRALLEAPQIAASMNLAALFKGQIHLRQAKLNLKRITVVKNRDGKLNIDALKPSQAQKEKQKAKVQKKEAGKPMGLLIDELDLSIGEVVYKDYSKGDAPSIQVFAINIQNRRFSHVTELQSIVSLIMFEALTRTTLGRLAEFDVSSFKDGALDTLSGSLDLVAEGGDEIGKTAKGVLGFFQ